MKVNTKLNESQRELVHNVNAKNFKAKFSHPIDGTKRVGKKLHLKTGGKAITLTGRQVSYLRELLNQI